jgi:hypothetical protein
MVTAARATSCRGVAAAAAAALALAAAGDNCTAVGEALCTADGDCAAFGVFRDQIQLHGCAALVPNPDWAVYVADGGGGYTRSAAGTNVNETACATHPRTGMQHSCGAPPPPPTERAEKECAAPIDPGPTTDLMIGERAAKLQHRPGGAAAAA